MAPQDAWSVGEGRRQHALTVAFVMEYLLLRLLRMVVTEESVLCLVMRAADELVNCAVTAASGCKLALLELR